MLSVRLTLNASASEVFWVTWLMCIKKDCTSKQMFLMRNPWADGRSSKYVNHKNQEARLYIACVASVLLPTGMLVFAWTARSDILWIVPLIGLTVSTPSHQTSESPLMDLPAFYGLHLRYISSGVRLPGRLVNASFLYNLFAY
jgi:hypothetical protein